MTAPFYAVALAVAVPMCILSDKTPKYTAFYAASVLLVFGTLMCALSAGIHAHKARYVFLCFINTSVWAGNSLTLTYISSVLGPVHPEVRAISFAIVNGCANLAQLYGTYIFTVSKAPNHVLGFSAYAAILATGGLIFIISFFLFRRWPYQPTEIAR